MTYVDEEREETPNQPPRRADGVCEGCNVRGPQGYQCEHNGCTCRICNPVAIETEIRDEE